MRYIVAAAVWILIAWSVASTAFGAFYFVAVGLYWAGVPIIPALWIAGAPALLAGLWIGRSMIRDVA